MSLSPYRLLEFVVGQYDDSGRPQRPTDIADQSGLSPAEAESQFERLRDCELVTREGAGYRPTITGRELLELDIDDEFVVVDAGEDCPGPD
jgi:DNA-binding IclR family transcriptional regulator